MQYAVLSLAVRLCLNGQVRAPSMHWLRNTKDKNAISLQCKHACGAECILLWAQSHHDADELIQSTVRHIV